MMKRTDPKRHHFVPQTYLKQFAISNDIYVLDILKVKDGLPEKPHKKHPRNICHEEDYYTINKNSSTDSLGLNQVEALLIETKVLHKLEKRYPELLRLITSHKVISLSDAIDIADFIVQMKLRNPYHLRETIRKNQSQWVEKILIDLLDNDPRLNVVSPEIKEEIREQLLQFGKNPEYAKGMQLFSLLERSRPGKNERMREALLNSAWEIIQIPQGGPRLITSDNPGIARGAENLYYNTRFKDGFVFYFPLSYEYCLVITDRNADNTYSNGREEKLIAHKKADKREIIEINDSLIQRLNKLIIASDDWYLKQIAENNKPHKFRIE